MPHKTLDSQSLLFPQVTLMTRLRCTFIRVWGFVQYACSSTFDSILANSTSLSLIRIGVGLEAPGKPPPGPLGRGRDSTDALSMPLPSDLGLMLTYDWTSIHGSQAGPATLCGTQSRCLVLRREHAPREVENHQGCPPGSE